MSIRERFIDAIVPERTFKKELNREIDICLEYFQNPYLVKGIGITVGQLGRNGKRGRVLDLIQGEERGYFWEKDGTRHLVGRETMSRKEKEILVNSIHKITYPYLNSETWLEKSG